MMRENDAAEEVYGYSAEVVEGYDEAIVRARLALKAEGFSIITEMHVGGMLGPEAGDQRQYLFLGAWNAPAARRAVDAPGDLEVAVHVPCNLLVQESGATAFVAALDPADAVEAGPEGALQRATLEALGRVLTRVQKAL